MSAALDEGSSTQKVHPFSERLSSVKGNGERTNDIFVFGDIDGKQHIIYFGGDIQDYTENMDGDNARFAQWSTEKTAALLHKKFDDSLIFIVKPKSMHLKTFANYSNFMFIKDFGWPSHSPDSRAMIHLVQLYKSACDIIQKQFKPDSATLCPKTQKYKECSNSQHISTKREEENKVGSQSQTDDLSNCDDQSTTDPTVKLVGFSRGCAVLNQLVYEIPPRDFHNIRDGEVKDFLLKISAFYWLDGGHNGVDTDIPSEHAWPTEPRLVKTLSDLGCSIHVHVTPYQVHDTNKPWKGRQYRKFCKLLGQFGAKCQVKEHFEGEPRSLENHFKVLEVF